MPNENSKKVKVFQSLGSPGYVITDGQIESNDRNPRLQGTEKYKTYSDIMANTVIVATGVRYFLSLIARANWSVEPVQGDSMSKKYADEITYMMDDMTTPWHRVVRRAAMYRFYGFSIQEWTAKRNARGSIGFMDIEPRPQMTIEKWDVDESGTVVGVVQRDPNTFNDIYLPRTKLIYTTDDTVNNTPEGLGLFRHLVKSSDRLNRLEELELFGFEADLRGIPVARAPLGLLSSMTESGEITEQQKIDMLDPLVKFMHNHIKNPKLGLLLDSSVYENNDDSGSVSNVAKWEIDLLGSGGSSGQAEVNQAIKRLTYNIAALLGIEGLMLDGRGGSYALSENKSDNFALIIDSTLRELEETFEKDFLDPIFEMNGWDPVHKPQLKTDKNQYRNVEKITTALEQLSRAGSPLMLDDPIVNEIRDMLGLSRTNFDADIDSALFGDQKLETVSTNDVEVDNDPDGDDDAANA